MNEKQKWILGAVALVLLLVIAGFGYQELQKEAKRVRHHLVIWRIASSLLRHLNPLPHKPALFAPNAALR